MPSGYSPVNSTEKKPANNQSKAGQRPFHLRTGQEAAGWHRHRQCTAPRPREHIFRGRRPRPRSAPVRSACAPFRQVTDQEHRHVGLLGVGARPCAGDGLLLRKQQAQKIVQAHLRRDRCGSALADERRPGRPGPLPNSEERGPQQLSTLPVGLVTNQANHIGGHQ